MTTGPELQLLERLGAADDPERAILESMLALVEQKDAEFALALRLCAIPKRLNAEVVGVLVERPDEDEDNASLLERVGQLSFVIRRQDGDLVYHDNVRDMLLTDWKSSPEKRGRFVEVNQALASFYVARYEESLRSARRLDEVAALMARANPERLRRLTGAVEATMAADLLEALYHRLLAGPHGGFEFFQTSFFDLESANRLSTCQSLVSFTRDFLQRLAPGESEPSLLAWLDYFDARVQRTLPEYDAAHVEAILRRLLESEDVPPDVATWALDDLALLYEAQLKMDGALLTRLNLVEQRSVVDVYNEPLRHSALGNLYWWLGDYPSAVPQLQLAIEKVDEVPGARADAGVFARLDLSAVYSEVGDWAAAFETGIEALYRARTSFANNHMIQQQAATRLAQLLSTFDVRASDCAAAEAIALVDARPEQRHAALLDRIDLLLQTGRGQTARAWTERLQAEAEEGDAESSTRHKLAFRRARVLVHEGRETDANAVYSTLLQEIVDRPEDHVLRIAALRNRGSNRATLGDTPGAVADLTAARDEWARSGSRIDVAGAQILMAEALAKAGDRAAAETLLDTAEAELPPGISQLRVTLSEIRGDLRERVGDWPAAHGHYEEALDIVTAIRDVARQASLLRKLAAVHAERAQWPISAESDRRAAMADEQLADADAYNAMGEERQAETDNGKGMRSFCDMEDRTTALDRARQLFCSANELDPENLWPLLNLSFTYAEQHDWKGASDALARVLDLSPAPMRTGRLYGSFRDYALEYARRLLARDDAGGAAAVVGAALDRLSGELPPAELAHLQAVQSVFLALAGERAVAQDAYRAALALAEEERPLTESMAPLINAANAYWTVDAVLQELQDDLRARSYLRHAAAATRAALGYRLDEVLGLTPDPSAQEIPVVTPIVGEVGDALVPIVDSRQDGGVFLYELIPAMRERILASTGVSVPGVRMRGNPALSPTGYSIQIDEVPVLTGSVALDASISVRPADDEARTPAEDLTDVHPLTGERGLWVIAGATDDDDGGGRLTPAQYLVHQIELVIRAHLVRYLGPQEVATLVDTWSTQDGGDLVSSVLPDADARLRLTWVLQSLVDEGVPITDWRALLTAIRDAGGIEAPTRTLCRAVRSRLRYALPGPRTRKRTVRVPAEQETTLLAQLPGGPPPVSGTEPRHEFLRWLRQTVAEHGGAITLVTGTQDAREVASALARTQDRLITTLSEDELT